MQAEADHRELKRKAEAAREKKAAFGEDIDLETFRSGSKDLERVKRLAELDEEEKRTLLQAGVLPTEEGRSGSFVLMDESVVHASSKAQGVEVMPLKDALKVHEWLKDYYWKGVSPEADKFTARTYLEGADGYFIHALPGTKVSAPVQTCLMLKGKGVAQSVHNIVIVEEGAELDVMTGCSTSKGVERALHLGISEFYIKKGAKLTFTMIHNWSEQIGVRPRTVIVQEEGSTFINNYVALRPVKSIQTYPTARLEGPGCFARFNSVAIAHPGSELDLGTRAVLSGEGSRCEMISRTIATGGKVIARGQMVGKARNVRGHLECRGLILGEGGVQIAIPELEAYVPDLEMTHEAAVGKIAQDQVEYLMARGLSEEEAVGIIVRGFLEVGIRGLPENLKREIDATMERTDMRAI
ncbi:MAG: SufD family Fe-S cluster assembly protein [Methanomassiliicoccales archaeon]|nr:SufD family Fe-S cluster assembly protein [Methanomassiliicoccales archaeon]